MATIFMESGYWNRLWDPLCKVITEASTLLGVGINVVLGLVGLDLPMGIRDLAACFTKNFNPSDSSWWLTLLGCLAAFIPGVGALKHLFKGMEYVDEAAGVVKHGSELYEKYLVDKVLYPDCVKDVLAII